MAMSTDISSCHHSGGGCHWHLEARDTAKRISFNAQDNPHRHNKELPGPKYQQCWAWETLQGTSVPRARAWSPTLRFHKLLCSSLTPSILFPISGHLSPTLDECYSISLATWSSSVIWNRLPRLSAPQLHIRHNLRPCGHLLHTFLHQVTQLIGAAFLVGLAELTRGKLHRGCVKCLSHGIHWPVEVIYVNLIGMNKHNITPLDEKPVNVLTKELDAFWQLFDVRC